MTKTPKSYRFNGTTIQFLESISTFTNLNDTEIIENLIAAAYFGLKGRNIDNITDNNMKEYLTNTNENNKQDALINIGFDPRTPNYKSLLNTPFEP